MNLLIYFLAITNIFETPDPQQCKAITNIFETPDPQQCEAKEVRFAKFFSILKPAFSDIDTLKKHMKYAKKKFELDVTEDEIELEKIALKDEYFIEKKLFPNVDFYSGIILKALGFPTSMFTVLFAIGRTVGWISQWKEMIEDPVNKIGRPRQLYTGYKERPYQVESSREKKSIFNWLWKKD